MSPEGEPLTSGDKSRSDLTFSYDLTHHQRKDPQVIEEKNRRMHTTIDYRAEGGDGDYLRLHSGWSRVDNTSLMPTPGEEKEQSAQVYRNWLWDRSLGIKWSPVDFGSLTIHSNTFALIDNIPPEVAQGESDLSFRLFTDRILRSIVALGTTDRYQGRYSITLHTPSMRHSLLSPLYASLSYSGDYSWRRGVVVGDRSSGHTIKNNGRLDLQAWYDLSLSLIHI